MADERFVDVDLSAESEGLQEVADDFGVEPAKLIKAAVRWLLEQDGYVIGGVLAAYDGDDASDELDDLEPETEVIETN